MAQRREYPISTFLNLVVTHWTQQEPRDLSPTDPPPTDPSLTFGFVHAFYAIMGGFAFLSEEYDDKTITVDESLFTLPVQRRADYKVPSFRALVYIMKHFPHLITNVSEETILDRTQSNSISKALLIVQVGWFCANCASRLIQHLPLSLLEVSTAAHALCTLLTYVVWWSKPLNIPEPIILRGREAREVYALLRCSGEEYEEALETAWKMARENTPEKASEKAPEKAPGTAPGMAPGDSSKPIGSKPANILATNALLRILQMDKIPEASRGYNFGTKFPDRSERLFGSIFGSPPGSLASKAREYGVVGWTIMVVSPILYGLVHSLAWSDQFPTPLERRIWRVSSVVVTCSGFVAALLNLVFDFLRWSRGPIPRLAEPVTYLVFSLLPVVHVLASGFLLVESFRQLFFLDPAAYQLPSWSNYWPHLS